MRQSIAIKKLKAIRAEYQSTELRKEVIDIMLRDLENYETAESYFSDLSHGCESGIVGELIYYSDTHPFAQKHIEDILNMMGDIEEETGEPLHIPTDTDKLNWLAWFGFEEEARRLANDLKIEY